MRLVPVTAVVLSAAALLAGCAQGKDDLRPPRSAAEGAWYASSQEQRREHCEAYRAHDPQRPVRIPSYLSEESLDEFADNFYDMLKEKC
ncbi:hypothetical protein ACTWJ9_17975 [Streptomyces sp. GDS52]|uniref:hypothetical protein n=1 Tax=Streptomyces sp. GDS52 TaxID=3406419 RepID=UPI003FD5F404